MTTAELLHRTRQQLQEAGIESAAAEAVLLLEAATGLERHAQLLSAEPVSTAQLATLSRLLSRRLQREPLQLILGRTHFYGLELKVAPGVLIPRPETETLVELSLQFLQGSREPLVIDVGSGSGAIALAVRAERPDARVIATDLSAAALQLAADNARRLDLPLQLVQSDLLQDETLQAAAASADLIISNPPYLPDSDRVRVSEEVQADPDSALYAGTDGLDVFRRLLEQARALLPAGSGLHVELDPRNVRQAAALAGDWSESRVAADLSGRERFLLLRA